MEMQNELFIVLSNLCNFKCPHCVTISSPNPKEKSELSSSEIDEIVSWVKAHPSIKRIHFSGGEPSLHIEKIKEFQSHLPKLEYAMTSNAWFGDSPEFVFDRIKLNVAYFSYDTFHKPFIKSEIFKKTLNESISRGIRTYIKITISNADDFTLLPDVCVDGVEVIINTLVNVGRANHLKLECNTLGHQEFWKSSCPSLGENRIDNLARILFFPGKGLTPCCGPLTEAKNADPNFVFSSVNKNYFEENMDLKFQVLYWCQYENRKN